MGFCALLPRACGVQSLQGVPHNAVFENGRRAGIVGRLLSPLLQQRVLMSVMERESGHLLSTGNTTCRITPFSLVSEAGEMERFS